jgi:hypothetical protein
MAGRLEPSRKGGVGEEGIEASWRVSTVRPVAGLTGGGEPLVGA